MRAILAAACGLTSGVLAGSPAASPGERPYAPLMTLMGGGLLVTRPTDEDVARIARTFQFVNAHAGMDSERSSGRSALWCGVGSRGDDGRTIGERIKALNPAFIASNYRNGSYVSQNCPWEAEEVERDFPLGIAVWDTGDRLAASVAADAAELGVVRGGPVPAGMPLVHPFKSSTTVAEHSQTARLYVAWVRIGDEILRVEAVSAAAGNGLALKVRRGIWGTKADAHGAGARVLHPVYIGSVRSGADTELSGVPDSKARQPGLRYALRQEDPGFHRWLGDKCQAMFAEGCDIVWLDVTSSACYNNSDAYGRPVTPWDEAARAPVEPETYRERQQQKLDALYRRFPGGRFFINNVKERCYFGSGHERKFFTGEGGHHPVTGGCIENFADTEDEDSWCRLVAVTLDMVKNDFWVVAWAKAGRRQNPEYPMFAYGTYLLAFEPGARWCFGCGQGVMARPPDFLWWDLGRPLVRFSFPKEARHPGAPGIYRREFSRALVLVNPNPGPSGEVPLDGDWLDPKTGHPVREISLPGVSCRILLKASPGGMAPSSSLPAEHLAHKLAADP